MNRLLVVFVSLVVTGAGCGGSRETERIPSGRAVLAAEEIAETPALNAYEAIQIRRPAFLIARGFKSLAGSARPVVYVNGMYFGDAESLKDIFASEVHSVRFVDGKEAAVFYGTNHVAGVIVVTTGLH